MPAIPGDAYTQGLCPFHGDYLHNTVRLFIPADYTIEGPIGFLSLIQDWTRNWYGWTARWRKEL